MDDTRTYAPGARDDTGTHRYPFTYTDSNHATYSSSDADRHSHRPATRSSLYTWSHWHDGGSVPHDHTTEALADSKSDRNRPDADSEADTPADADGDT